MALTSESFDDTLARRRRAQDAFPELQYSTPTQIAEVDGAYPDRLPTSFTQQAVRLANYASDPADDPNAPDATPNAFPWKPSTSGMLESGNIDLSNRPRVRNADNSISTVRSISVDIDGRTYLIPTVVGDRVVSNDEAIRNFQQTGQHLGVFGDQQSADTYAEQLHNQQADMIAGPGPLSRGYGQQSSGDEYQQGQDALAFLRRGGSAAPERSAFGGNGIGGVLSNLGSEIRGIPGAIGSLVSDEWKASQAQARARTAQLQNLPVSGEALPTPSIGDWLSNAAGFNDPNKSTPLIQTRGKELGALTQPANLVGLVAPELSFAPEAGPVIRVLTDIVANTAGGWGSEEAKQAAKRAGLPEWAQELAGLGGGLAAGGIAGTGAGIVSRNAKTWMEVANLALDDARGAEAKVAEASQIGRAANTDSLFTAGPNGEVVGPTGNVAELRLGREPVMGEDVNAGLRRTAYGRAQQEQLAAEEQAAFRDAGERAISGAVPDGGTPAMARNEPANLSGFRAGEQQLGPVPEGYVRLYRGEPEGIPGQAGRQVTFNPSLTSDPSGNVPGGSWYTTTLDSAYHYGAESGGVPRVYSLDLPATEAARFEHGAGRGEYVIPPEVWRYDGTNPRRSVPWMNSERIAGGAHASAEVPLTPDEFSRIAAKKARGEALTPEEDAAVWTAAGRALGATTPAEQAAARSAFYEAPENLGGGQGLTPEQHANVSGTVQRAGQLNTVRDSLANARNMEDVGVGDYRGQHGAPMRDSGAPLHDLTGGGDVYPADVYSRDALNIYGTGDAPVDRQALRVIRASRGNPDAEVTIYRAVPKDAPDTINPGDWVTTVRDYAAGHGDGPLGGDAKIISQTVKASDLYTNGDSWLEYGYDPKGSQPSALDSVIARNADTLPEPTRTQPSPGYLDKFKRPSVGGGANLPGSEPPLVPQGGSAAPRQSRPTPQTITTGDVRASLERDAVTPLEKPSLLNQVVDVANAPRSILTSFDLSAPFRQGAMLVGHPREFFGNLKPMLEAFASKDAAETVDAAIRSGSRGAIKDQAGLYLSPLDNATASLTQREEAYMSRLTGKVPGVAGSQRAYATFLNKTRSDVFDHFWESLPLEAQTIENAQRYAHFINAATGRGSLPNAVKNLAPALNAAFFSPRYFVSRFESNGMGVKAIADVAKGVAMRQSLDPVAKQIAGDVLKFYAAGASALTLAAAAGANVELDPRSSDFGKIKVGDTRYDIWAGNQQIARFIAQEASGQRNSNGVISENPRNRVALNFLRSKLAPLPGLSWDTLKGTTPTGDKVDSTPASLRRILFNEFVPMIAQDIITGAQDGGAFGIAKTLPTIFGVGTQTYAPTPPTGSGSRPTRPTRPVRPSRPSR